jgi:putative flippase GtrA
MNNILQAGKYLSISIGMYIAVFSAMYILVDLLKIDKALAFVVTYFFAYIATYLINLNYLFYEDHSWHIVAKFIIHIIFFLGSGSLLFKLLTDLGLHYLIATFLTALALLPLRFIAQKYFVFTRNSE